MSVNRRYCMAVDLKNEPQLIEQYKQYHMPDKVWPEITDSIKNAGIEDMEILKEHGRRILRQNRIQRLCEEALEQKGILSQEDLARHLGCSIRTIKRDIKEIKLRAAEVITRGVLHNIGRGQTHKVQIINLYLEGCSYSEIRRKTHHSTGPSSAIWRVL